MPRYIIAVCGNIGVGKSTLCRELAERCGAKLVCSSPNPYVHDSYMDPKRYALAAHISFLVERVRSIQEVMRQEKDGIIVIDRAIYEGMLFANMSRRLGYIDSRDWDTYRKIYSTLCSTIPAPDVILYLHTDLDTLEERVTKRSRPEDARLTRDYLFSLQMEYCLWKDMTFPCPLISFDWTTPRHIEEVLALAFA
jgi:deoxyadenosine/deoxycytidine kinase